MAVGFSQSGSGGLINLLAAFSDNKIVAAVLCVITCTGWVVDGLFGMWLWKEVHAHYRAGGHSLQHARTQAVAFGIRAGAGAGAENAV